MTRGTELRWIQLYFTGGVFLAPVVSRYQNVSP